MTELSQYNGYMALSSPSLTSSALPSKGTVAPINYLPPPSSFLSLSQHSTKAIPEQESLVVSLNTVLTDETRDYSLNEPDCKSSPGAFAYLLASVSTAIDVIVFPLKFIGDWSNPKPPAANDLRAKAWSRGARTMSSRFDAALQTFSRKASHTPVTKSAFTWKDRQVSTGNWAAEDTAKREIPTYVLDHAPLIYLYSKEEFWPCDIEEHLLHTTPFLNYTPLPSSLGRPNLTNLDDWNRFGRFIYLQSNDNVEERPSWLSGKSNIPTNPDLDDGQAAARKWEQDNGQTQFQFADPKYHDQESSQERPGGRSSAPAVLLVVNKGHGIVDAFWFFFYSYNLGNKVLNVRFGNHVGDWEHTLVRFKNGKPQAVFFSEHFFGQAYSWAAVEKIGKRPVGYSAVGTHAMYGVPGVHRYILPLGLLSDETDRGPLWDPLLNSHTYTYEVQTDVLRSSNVTPKAPTEWFYYIGHWGDKAYSLDDSRQYQFAGQYHYVNGPLGPRFKNLGREKVCPGSGECVIRHWRGQDARPRKWIGHGAGDEMGAEDLARIEGTLPHQLAT